jgi:hypothetical protein
MNDLIARLLDEERLSDLRNCNRHLVASDMREAAAVIKAQTAEIAALREALTKVQEWIRYDLEAGTPNATTMLVTVNGALIGQSAPAKENDRG